MYACVCVVQRLRIIWRSLTSPIRLTGYYISDIIIIVIVVVIIIIIIILKPIKLPATYICLKSKLCFKKWQVRSRTSFLLKMKIIKSDFVQ